MRAAALAARLTSCMAGLMSCAAVWAPAVRVDTVGKSSGIAVVASLMPPHDRLLAGDRRQWGGGRALHHRAVRPRAVGGHGDTPEVAATESVRFARS